jgi:putative ABC transport system ATP-binding protein
VGVSRTYAGEVSVAALDDADLRIEEGEFVAIVGASGSGKSTLLNILGLLDRPTKGSYRLAGRETTGLSDRERAAIRGTSVGFVFQDFHLIPHRTVLENVALSGIYSGAPKGERLQHARAALEAVDLSHRASFLPGQISGGEKQRAAIARAVAGKPPLLLCDEPTGNLDSARSAGIVSLFQQMNEAGFTVVMVTHDAGVAAQAGRTIVVQDGKVSS